MNIVYIILLFLLLITIAFTYCINNDKNIFQEFLYLDNNATTEPASDVTYAMGGASKLGNASSTYATESKKIIDSFKSKMQELFPNKYCIITSSASESNSLVMNSFKGQIATTNTEHKSILIPAISHNEYIIESDIYGRINTIPNLPNNIKLVSVIHYNNEIGTINNIGKLYDECKRKGYLFHTDATQSFGKYPINADLITINFHKNHGPIGIGVLLINPNLVDKIKPIVFGMQNDGLRGGTENIPAIAGALASLSHSPKININIKKYLLSKLSKHSQFMDFNIFANKPDNFEILGNGFYFVPLGSNLETLTDPNMHAINNLTISIFKLGPFNKHFCNIKLKNKLISDKIAISIGSACNSNSKNPSHVLNAIKAPFSIRCGVIRISWSINTTKKDIDKFVHKLIEGIKEQF